MFSFSYNAVHVNYSTQNRKEQSLLSLYNGLRKVGGSIVFVPMPVSKIAKFPVLPRSLSFFLMEIKLRAEHHFLGH